ncbi:MAG: C39 family peptidase [Lachnospiraceae bacterium]
MTGTGNTENHTGKRRIRKRRRHRFFRRLVRAAGICLMIAVLFLAGAMLWEVGSLIKDTITGDEREESLISEVIHRISLQFRKGQLKEEIPESLLELMEKYPETEEFVLSYPDCKYDTPDRDLSGEVTEGEIPLFLQWDRRWGYESYGDDFLAVTGCGPTCLSMVYCGLTGDTGWNPYEMANFADREGYYVEGSGSAWDLMIGGAEKLGLQVHEVIFDEEHMIEELKEGRPIICTVRPGDFTTSGHFIVLKGLDRWGKILVCDPNSKRNSDRSWSIETLMPQIKNLWSYSYSS